MQISYINHASLVIESADARLATDPWFAGPAYANQWHPFPKPTNVEQIDGCDAVLISHGHEDHLHEPSLNRLTKSKRLFYPFNWYPGTVEWIRSFGFAEVTEAASCQTYVVAPSTRVTFVVNGHDSIMVLEDGGEVVVNINDALHSSEPSVIDAFTSYLKQRWPKIDAVFCGFGGASYFPNTIHGPGKDDRAVAWLREQLFAHNFCRIVSRLEPRVAVPFAADFALLAREQQWINEVRFPREWLPRYFREQGGKSEIAVMYSGDRLIDGRLDKSSPIRDRMGRSHELLTEQYPLPVSALVVERPYAADRLETLCSAFAAALREQIAFYPPAKVQGLVFSVRLRDVVETPWLNVSLGPRTTALVERAPRPHDKRVAEIETTAEVLEKCIESEWGGDAVIIGYACDVRVLRGEDLRNGLGKLCVELCVRHPHPGAYAKAHPLRVAKFLAQTPFALALQAKQKALAMLGRSASIVNGTHWLTGSPGEIRRICGLPDLAPPRDAIAT
jgi:hypothetical protein